MQDMDPKTVVAFAEMIECVCAMYGIDPSEVKGVHITPARGPEDMLPAGWSEDAAPTFCIDCGRHFDDDNTQADDNPLLCAYCGQWWRDNEPPASESPNTVSRNI